MIASSSTKPDRPLVEASIVSRRDQDEMDAVIDDILSLKAAEVGDTKTPKTFPVRAFSVGVVPGSAKEND